MSTALFYENGDVIALGDLVLAHCQGEDVFYALVLGVGLTEKSDDIPIDTWIWAVECEIINPDTVTVKILNQKYFKITSESEEAVVSDIAFLPPTSLERLGTGTKIGPKGPDGAGKKSV